MCTTSGQHSAAGGGGGAALPAAAAATATAAASAATAAIPAATAIADLSQHSVGQSAGQWQSLLQSHLSIPLLQSLSRISVRFHHAATSAAAHVLAAAPALQQELPGSPTADDSPGLCGSQTIARPAGQSTGIRIIEVSIFTESSA